MINRKHYEEKIKTALSRQKIVALLGPRQVGKTTLAKKISKKFNASFYDCESPLDQSILENPYLHFKPEDKLVIIDEVQLMPKLFSALRVISDQFNNNGQFLLLGSASPDIIKGVSQTLAGRIEFVNIQGFDIREVDKQNKTKLWLRGGFPDSLLARNDEDSLVWRKNFIQTFLERDLALFGKNLPSKSLHRFWTMLAHSQGQVLNLSKFGASLGLSSNTLRHWLDTLIGTFMILELAPWYSNLKKRQIKSPKIYIRDTGLVHALVDIGTQEILYKSPVLGASYESFIVQQIIQIFPQISFYFWSTHQGAKIDLFFNLAGKNYGIEIKYMQAPSITKSMLIACEDLSLEKLWVVYPGEGALNLSENIRSVSLPECIKEIGQI